MTGERQVFAFQAEIQRLLHLIVHSLYANRDIFLRELVANAADALDRLRLRRQTEPDLEPTAGDPRIVLRADPSARTLEVEDNGVGMTRAEMVELLGTIARSGTAEFVKRLEAAQPGTGPDLIGQFGVGFYSAFMVADKVEVYSRTAGQTEAHLWVSTGDGEFAVEPTERTGCGTTVRLHLKSAEATGRDYTDLSVLRQVVKRHADYVPYPILTGPPDGGEPGPDPLNARQAIWARSREELTDTDCQSFYTHLCHDPEPPLARLHVRGEGRTEFHALLFIPNRPPLAWLGSDRTAGVDLYCRRVLVVPACADLLPPYLRFVRGVVDSADLNLNISREMLQQNRLVEAIRRNLVKRLLDLLAGLERERYERFWSAFGPVLKEGVAMEHEHRDRLLDLLRFRTTRGGDDWVSLAEVAGRLKPGQTDIWHLTGEGLQSLRNSPALERLRDREEEVLLLTDPVDELMLFHLTEYKGHRLRSAGKGDLGLEPAAAERQAALSGLLDHFKSTLGDRVRDVRLSGRLTGAVACLAGSDDDPSLFLEKLLSASQPAGPTRRRVLELNPTHPVLARLDALHRREPDSPLLAESAELLFEAAVAGEGGRLADPAGFLTRLGQVMTRSLPE